MIPTTPAWPAPTHLTTRPGDPCQLCHINTMRPVVNLVTGEATTGIIACPHCDGTRCPGLQNGCPACMIADTKTYPDLNGPPPITENGSPT